MSSFIVLVSSIFFRFLSWTFLRWLPGRQGTYSIPVLFLIANYPLFKSLLLPSPSSTVHDETLVIVEEVVVEKVEHPSYAKVTESGNSDDVIVEREEEADITIITPPRSSSTTSSPLSSILFGTKSSYKTLNLLSFLLNLTLLLCVLDSLWSPIFSMEEQDLTFVRPGHVTHHSVSLQARIPPSSYPTSPFTQLETESDEQEVGELNEFEGAKVEYRATKPVGKWIKAGKLVVEEERDWTGVLKIDDLWSSTEYEYRLLLPSLLHSYHPSFSVQKFTTAPDPSLTSYLTQPAAGGGTHYTFASSSCIKPGFPYTGPWDKRVVKGARYLSDRIEKEGIRFLLFLGDFIYADTPYYPGPKQDNYQKRYRQVFASEDIQAVTSKIPLLAIYDDHEVFNDFDKQSSDPRFAPANSAWQNYMGHSNPTPAEIGENYFEYQYGDSAFFVWDTRKFRSENGAEDVEGKTMLGERQKLVFLDWLRKVNQTITFKFVVSSTPMMTLWSHGSDTWAGFQTEREELLDVMQYVPNVIVLSGDRHEFAAAGLRNGTITEFSTSPLSQFYLPIRTLSQSHGRGATGEDVLLKYLPDGNTKFTTFEVDTRISNKPVVKVQVIIDGELAWKVEVLGTPLVIPPPVTTVGSLGKSLMELLGFKNRKWF